MPAPQISPGFNRVIVTKQSRRTKTDAGVYLPDQHTVNDCEIGIVQSVGPCDEKFDDINNAMVPGAVVLFQQNTGQAIIIKNTEEGVALYIQEIIGIVKEDPKVMADILTTE